MKQLYTCICCGYETHRKPRMYLHLYKKKKPCCKSVNDIELTDEIRDYILTNRVYHIPKTSESTHKITNCNNKTLNQTLNQTINNVNQFNVILNNIDPIKRLNKYINYNNMELIDFQDKVEDKYGSRVKRLNEDKYKSHAFSLNKDDLLEIMNEMSDIIGHVEEFNVIFDEKCNKMKILEGGEWETYLIDRGIKKLIMIIQDGYLDAYECFLLRKMRTTSSFEKQVSYEHLCDYYKFLGCFDIDPFVKNNDDQKIMTYGRSVSYTNYYDYDNYTFQDEYIPIYKSVTNTTMKADISRIKKQVIDIFKRNTKNNLEELNKRMMSIIQMDEEFKKIIIEDWAGTSKNSCEENSELISNES